MKTTNAVLCLLFASTLAGCMMAPVRPQVPHLGSNLAVGSTAPDQAKLVFINNSSKLLHGADATGLINVTIDGVPAGGPNVGEFFQVQVPKGKHKIEVCHLDVIKFRTEQEVVVDRDLVIELKATPFANKILVQTTMPAGKFRPLVVAAEEPQKPNLFQRSTARLSSYTRSLR